MVLNVEQLEKQYHEYRNPVAKINREVKNGNIFPLTKGLYETENNTDRLLLAQSLYGPSYVSFDYVLCLNGFMVDGLQDVVTCATFRKRKSKVFRNTFGTFIYRDVPSKAFPYGVKYFESGQYSILMATKEKAFCDKLYISTPVRSMKDFKELLFEDLRIYEDCFEYLNLNDLLELAPLYHSNNLNLLVKLIKEEKF